MNVIHPIFFNEKWEQLIQPSRGLLGGLLRLVGPDGRLLDPLQSLQDAGGIWADEIGFANRFFLIITEIG